MASPVQFECSAPFAGIEPLMPAFLEVGPQLLTWKLKSQSADVTGPQEDQTVRVPFCCIYGYQFPDEWDKFDDPEYQTTVQPEEMDQTLYSARVITLNYVDFIKPDLLSVPKLQEAALLFKTRAEVAEFVRLTQGLKAYPQRKRVLLLVNPNGGTGTAKKVSDTIVKPMLKLAGMEVTEQYTQYGKHAIDIAYKLDLSQTDLLAVVSGDGLLHEAINGLLSRPDWDRARRLPLAVIPAGSGNALATSIGIQHPQTATLALIRGCSEKLDILSLTQKDRPRIYSFLSFNWGMMADSDIESDRYRWMGYLRFELAGFLRMINLRRYPGKVYYLPQEESSTVSTLTPPHSPDHTSPATYHSDVLGQDLSEQDEMQAEQGGDDKESNNEVAEKNGLPAPWTRIPNMNFYTFLLLLKHPFAAATCFFSHQVSMNDGCMNVWYSDETRFMKILGPFVKDQMNGMLIHRGLMKHLKCRALLVCPAIEGDPNSTNPSTFEYPDHTSATTTTTTTTTVQEFKKRIKDEKLYSRPGIFDVDGEIMPTARTLFEILPGFVELMVPVWYDQVQRENVDKEKEFLAQLKKEEQQQPGHQETQKNQLTASTTTTRTTTTRATTATAIADKHEEHLGGSNQSEDRKQESAADEEEWKGLVLSVAKSRYRPVEKTFGLIGRLVLLLLTVVFAAVYNSEDLQVWMGLPLSSARQLA